MVGCDEITELKKGLDEVTDGQGWKVMTQLVLTYFLYCKAIARDCVVYTLYSYFAFVLRQNTSDINNYQTAALSPFGMKTLWGSMSDAIPCFGYHKRYYIMWGVCVSMTAISLLAFLFPPSQFEAEPASAGVAALVTILFFMSEYGNATVDSLSQAKYTEYMKLLNTPTIVSFVWFLIQFSGIFTSFGNLLIGADFWDDVPGGDNLKYKILLYIAVPMGLPMLVPASMNWLLDNPAASFCSPDMSRVNKHRKLFILSMFLAFGALGGTMILIFSRQIEAAWENGSTIVRLVYYVGLSISYVPFSFWALPKIIAKPALYMYLCSSFRLFFTGTLQGWYTLRNEDGLPDNRNATSTNTEWCIRTGPGFSVAYYQFVGALVGAIASICAVFIFEKSISKWPVRRAFWVTTIFQMVSACIELMMLERAWHSVFGTKPGFANSQWVDQVGFMVGTQALDKIIEMLDFMPCNVLIGKLCPPNMEATIFAVLAGSQNLGANIARVFGGLAVEALGVEFQVGGPNDDFAFKCSNPFYSLSSWSVYDDKPAEGAGFGLHGLSIVRFAGGFILPFLTIPLTFWLLPDKLLTDDFLDDDEALEMARAEAMADSEVDGAALSMGVNSKATQGGSIAPTPSMFSNAGKGFGVSGGSVVALASMTHGGAGGAAGARML